MKYKQFFFSFFLKTPLRSLSWRKNEFQPEIDLNCSWDSSAVPDLTRLVVQRWKPMLRDLRSSSVSAWALSPDGWLMHLLLYQPQEHLLTEHERSHWSRDDELRSGTCHRDQLDDTLGRSSAWRSVSSDANRNTFYNAKSKFVAFPHHSEPLSNRIKVVSIRKMTKWMNWNFYKTSHFTVTFLSSPWLFIKITICMETCQEGLLGPFKCSVGTWGMPIE